GDRVVDLSRWHRAHPGQTWPNLVYWGHYVAHDNNRDAMGLTLKLSQNVLNTYVDSKAQAIHDPPESVPHQSLTPTWTGRAGSSRICTNQFRPSMTTRSATGPTTPGSIRW